MPRSLNDVLAAAGISLVDEGVGEGGSAVVHKGRVDRAGERLPPVGSLVAVKEYKPEILRAPNQLARIRQEAGMGLLVRHPNVVGSYGLAGDAGTNGDEPVALLLEWIEGPQLDAWFPTQMPSPSWDTLRGVALGLAEAVAALHTVGVFHRDIKPENVMLRGGTSPVLMDVGIAELTGNDSHTLHTSVRDFVGSARFAAPQFLRGEQFTAGEDVYSLAATLFLLFTGRQVYAEVERKPLIPVAVIAGPPRIDALLECVPAPTRVLLEGALNADRDRRPSLAEFRECLEHPEAAAYITKEIDAQATEARGFRVLSLYSDGHSFFADLRGNSPSLGERYAVVRQAAAAIAVPSLNRDVVPEVRVADAVLQHVNQGIGQFGIRRRRWVPPKSTFGGLSAATSVMAQFEGHWVDEEGSQLTVASGDLVVRATSRTGYVV